MVHQKIKSAAIKLIILFLFTILIYYSNGNSGNESFGSIQSTILSAGLAIAVFLPGKRPLVLLFAILMWSVMIGYYLVEAWDFAIFFGSIGFGLIFLVTLTYIPQLLETGYIADFQKWFKE